MGQVSEEGATLAKAKEQRAGVGKFLCPDGLATPEYGKFEGDRGGREFVPLSKDPWGVKKRRRRGRRERRESRRI